MASVPERTADTGLGRPPLVGSPVRLSTSVFHRIAAASNKREVLLHANSPASPAKCCSPRLSALQPPALREIDDDEDAAGVLIIHFIVVPLGVRCESPKAAGSLCESRSE